MDPWVAMHLIGKRDELNPNDLLDENGGNEDANQIMEKEKRHISLSSNRK